jgi:serine/threonine-protein kinase HipA
MFDVNPAPDRNPHLETAILEGGAHNRSIALALEACEFFEIDESDARTMIREMAVRIAGTWREVFRDAGVIGAQARSFEPAFEHDEAKLAMTL